MNYYWYKLVINYDLGKQMRMFNALKSSLKKPDFKLSLSEIDPGRHAPYAGVVVALGLLAFLLLKPRRTADERLIARFLGKMASHGYERGRSEGLEEFLARVGDENLRVRAALFTEEFERIYYTDRKFTSEDVRRLEQNIREL